VSLSFAKSSQRPFEKPCRSCFHRLEMLRSLVMEKATLSDHDSFDLVWNRFANTRGKVDSNIELDRRMEHRIRQAKEFMNRLGPNFTPATAQRYTRSLDVLEEISIDLENAFESPVLSTRHTDPDRRPDILKLAEFLHVNRVFFKTPERENKANKRFKSLYATNFTALQSWATRTLRHIEDGTTWSGGEERDREPPILEPLESLEPWEPVEPVEPELEYLFPILSQPLSPSFSPVQDNPPSPFFVPAPHALINPVFSTWTPAFNDHTVARWPQEDQAQNGPESREEEGVLDLDRLLLTNPPPVKTRRRRAIPAASVNLAPPPRTFTSSGRQVHRKEMTDFVS